MKKFNKILLFIFIPAGAVALFTLIYAGVTQGIPGLFTLSFSWLVWPLIVILAIAVVSVTYKVISAFSEN